MEPQDPIRMLLIGFIHAVQIKRHAFIQSIAVFALFHISEDDVSFYSRDFATWYNLVARRK